MAFMAGSSCTLAMVGLGYAGPERSGREHACPVRTGHEHACPVRAGHEHAVPAFGRWENP